MVNYSPHPTRSGVKTVGAGGQHGDDLHVKRGGPFLLSHRLRAILGTTALLSLWVGGSLSPLILVFLLWRGYWLSSAVLVVAITYPYIFTLKPWPFVRWLLAHGIHPRAYYHPNGYSVTFKSGSLAAIQVQSESDYFRQREQRRLRARARKHIAATAAPAAAKPIAVTTAPGSPAAAGSGVYPQAHAHAAVAAAATPKGQGLSPTPSQDADEDALPASELRVRRSGAVGSDSGNGKGSADNDGESDSAEDSSVGSGGSAPASPSVSAGDVPAPAMADASASHPGNAGARRPVLLAFHPHGIFPMSFWLGGVVCPEVYRVNPSITFLIASALYYAPLFIFVVRWLGKFGPADRQTMEGLLARGQDVALIPGGFEEATIYERGVHRLYLKHRGGFIKLALQHGYTVVPVYTFGEEKNYWNFPYFHRLRLWLNRFQIPGVLPWGSPGILPARGHAMDTVFGEPLELPCLPQATAADVAHYHAVYVGRVRALFEANKARFGQPDAVLEIV